MQATSALLLAGDVKQFEATLEVIKFKTRSKLTQKSQPRPSCPAKRQKQIK